MGKIALPAKEGSREKRGELEAAVAPP